MSQRITLQKGDYVATADIKDEAEYHAIARAFMEAGADSGEYPAPGQVYPIFGWREKGDKLFHGFNNSSWGKRQLTPAQILATPQWVPEAGECLAETAADCWEPCNILAKSGDYLWIEMPGQGEPETYGVDDIALRPMPSEEDLALEAMLACMEDDISGMSMHYVKRFARTLHKHGYRKQPQPAEDLTDPANWRAGDLVTYHGGDSPLGWYTIGKQYMLVMEHGKLGVIDNDGDFVCQGVEKGRFNFHSRP